MKNVKKIRNIPEIQKLEFQNVNFGFKSKNDVFSELNFVYKSVDQNLSVEAVDGSGKSCLLSLAALLYYPTSGQILINGMNVTNMSFGESVDYRLSIGYSFENEGLLSNQSIENNISLGAKYSKVFSESDIASAADFYLKYFEIEKFRNERPANVSFKVRKIVSIIRALFHQPSLLILDEPTVGLSVNQVDLLTELLKQKQEQSELCKILYTSSDLKFCNVISGDKIGIEDKAIVYRNNNDFSIKVAS